MTIADVEKAELSPEKSPPTSPESDSSELDLHRTQDGSDDVHHKVKLTKTKSIAESLSLPHEIAFVGIVVSGQFCTQAGLSQCLVLINIIGESFDISDPTQLSWLIAGYSLTVGTFIFLFGRMGDLFGYKRMLLIGFSWFSIWSVIAGLAVYSNHVLFVFARVFQGIGPAIVLPNGLALLGATYAPGKRKAMVFSIFGACAPVGSVIGGTFASLFALAWWPWAFWSLGIALAGLTIAAYFIVPDPPKKAAALEPLRKKINRMDLPGATLGITALILINFAWNQAPIVGWKQPYVYIILILGLILIPIFFYVELRVSNYPLIPFDTLSTDVAFVLACIACGWASFGIWIYYIFNFLLNLRDASPLLTMAYVSPVAVSGVFAAVCTGWLLGKFRPSVVMMISMTAFTVGTILIMTAPVHQIYWAQTFVCLLIIPWGMDLSFPAATLILSNAVTKEHQGIAASLVNTVVNWSISIGLGFAGTVEVHVNNGGLTRADLLKGYRGGWYIGVGLSGLGMIVSLIFLAKNLQHDRKHQEDVRKPLGEDDI